ncbi:pyridoxal phosphate phosphatase PHOSPHO2-like [Pectinophora gossypiella]|uniref:pyridoxal phosphate phosphatase PHOSPHO2-like n=1 Tax=Pectinophora gossypiella TaxID=13191 RepID=UPI00214E263F|nr:pyridoxal phosphate phosphatase PHOSPHO2-like [Pectinophora gossypiella]
MSRLAVFDFDRTIVDDDSDATIINKLREKKPPPEFDSSSHDWTPYMSDVFEHAFTSGFSQEDILAAIASMRPTAGVEQLISSLATAGWDVLVLTDANSVFVNHWIKIHNLQDAVTSVITNRAFWQNGRLYIEPCMRQSACARCPSNLCKSVALAQWCAQRPPYTSIVYSGDGRNDYCPATNLPPHAIVFPRRGYPLDDMIKKTLSTPTPQVAAKVVPWDDCHTIIRELFPEQSHIICPTK